MLHDIDALKSNTVFTDDITLDKFNDKDGIEQRADQTASDSLITPQQLHQHIGTSIPSSSKISILASQWQTHPAIIAGRIQRENNNYKILNDFKKDTGVRHLFL